MKRSAKDFEYSEDTEQLAKFAKGAWSSGQNYYTEAFEQSELLFYRRPAGGVASCPIDGIATFERIKRSRPYCW